MWQLLEGLQDAVGARVDADGRKIAPGDDAVTVDHEKRALAEAVGLAIGAILLGHLALRFEVGEQREIYVACAGKCRVALPSGLPAVFGVQRRHGGDEHCLGHAFRSVASDVARYLAAAGRVADVDGVLQVELRYQFREIAA